MVKDLTQGNPTKLILGFVASMIIGSLMSYVYNVTDSMMVGQFVSPDALGAISAGAPLNMFLANISTGTISGFGIVVGQTFGAGDRSRLRRVSAHSVCCVGGIVLIMTAVSIVICRPALEWMHTPAGFLDMAYEYMIVIFIARIFSLFNVLFSGMMRALGDSKTSLYISMLSGLANVGFNYLFLKVIPLGIAGAAWGTFCSCILSFILYLLVMWKRMALLHFGKEDMRFSSAIARRLFGNGLPLGVQSSIVALGSIILQVAVNSHGEAVVTGIATGGKLLSLFWIFFQSFESALIYFSAQNLGAGRVDRIREGSRSTLLINMGIGVFCFAVAFFVSRYVHMLFVGGDEELLRISGEYLISQIVFFPFMVMLCTWRGTLKGCGSTTPALFCGLIELVMRTVVSVFFSGHLFILFMAGPLAWVGASVFLAFLCPRALKKQEMILAKKAERMRNASEQEKGTADLKNA